MERLRQSTGSRRFALLLALLALAFRLAVPQGYMPGTDRTGQATLILCSGNGPMAMPAAAHHAMADMAAAMGGHHDSQSKHDADHACPFAVATLVAERLGDTTALPPPPTAATHFAVALPGDVRPGLGLAAPPPPKTGPPALA